MTQHFTTQGAAPTQTSLVPFVALGVGGKVDLGQGWFAILDVAGETHFMRLQRDDRSSEQQDVGFALQASLGAGKHF
jgi:hypothetical protein